VGDKNKALAVLLPGKILYLWYRRLGEGTVSTRTRGRIDGKRPAQKQFKMYNIMEFQHDNSSLVST
jgi:hypothetical protein